MDFKEVLKRINALYNKSKNEGLTEEEKKEQAEIRKYYISVITGNVKGNLNKVEKIDKETNEKKRRIDMKFTGTTYRPPVEGDTVLLQVTEGCAHNKCTFCTMYKDTKFSIEQLSQIEKDILQIKEHFGNINRIFLVNGDAFVLSARRLKEISDLLIKHIPSIETISMYASVSNIKGKSDSELVMLKEARINDLYIGLETGHEATIDRINKGHTLEDAYTQLERLNKTGIVHHTGLMLGVAGKGLGIENAKATAKLLNTVKPGLIWAGTLGIFEGSELSAQVEKGEFTPASELEIIEEEIELLNSLELKNIKFYGVHPTNTASIYGVLPNNKEELIQKLQNTIEKLDNEVLNSSVKRHSL
nr:radical SAM protein [Oceanirhabdus seepicola]